MLTLPHYETIDGKLGKYENAVFPRMKNLRTKKTNNGRNFDWPIQQLSINQKRERQTFRKRFASRCFFVSPRPLVSLAAVFWKKRLRGRLAATAKRKNSVIQIGMLFTRETKIEPDIRLIFL